MRFEQYEFGLKYADAHLAKIDLPPEVINQIMEWKTRDRGVLTFSGNPGVGKTYLAAALTKAWLESGQVVRYYTSRNFFSALRMCMKNDQDYHFEMKRLCESKYFILDDMGATQFSDWQKEVIFDFLDIRSSSLLPTLITTNLTMAELKDELGPRFISRVKDRENRLITLTWKDKRSEG
jgi:DNA replication protein DnaC